MSTVYISIGNSDDKLTQREWSEYVDAVDGVTHAYGHVHGCWFSSPGSPYQNATWCVEFAETPANAAEAVVTQAKARLSVLCGQYRQDSIAWAVAETEFIGPAVES